jgi:UDP-2,3-diacylglucosamine hydrolase
MDPGPVAQPMAAEPAIRIAHDAAALFASDMHLDDTCPALTERFLESLDRGIAGCRAEDAPALFLLGDLFEYWIGDDHVPPAAQALCARLAAFGRTGGRVYLMHGNRDFLLDVPLPSRPDVEPFSARCGTVLLADPTVIAVGGRRIALSHGDALCTDDVRYQQWRALCRSPAWQQAFLARPVAERLTMARNLRQQSMQAKAVTETVSDVNPGAVEELMNRLDTALLIHGHTHRPMVHRLPSARKVGARERWVLSDWAVSPPRGDVVSLAAIPPAC